MAKDEIKIINTEQAQQIDPELAEAGWKRDEQLAQRKDALAQAAEQASEDRELYAFDPSKFDPEREIQNQLDELNVDNAQLGWRYFWCYEGQNGRFILLAQRQGWQVVQSNDPEAPSLKDARGYRKIGDTILMRTPEANYQKIEAIRDYRNKVREQGVTSTLQEMSDKYRSKGIKMVDPHEKSIGRGGTLMDAMEKNAQTLGARQTAMKGVDTMLRNGTVPGLPKGGK